VGLDSLNWQDASTFCTSLITLNDQSNGVVTHLLSIDSLTESIIVNVYLTNLNFNPSFWTDGVTTLSSQLKIWHWNNSTFSDYGYLKYTFDKMANIYLLKNSSNNYEIKDGPANTSMSYICEAQGFFNK
jgi:hypothetical protein